MTSEERRSARSIDDEVLTPKLVRELRAVSDRFTVLGAGFTTDGKRFVLIEVPR